jgi:ABC-2 type transport system ATP-binding protein
MVGLAGEGRTILISSHQIVEVERIASHVAFMSQGKLLLAATMDELRQRVVQLRLRYEGAPPDAHRLGKVLQRNGTGNTWQAIIQDPDRTALNALYGIEHYFDVEEEPLDLEDVYCALLSRKE